MHDVSSEPFKVIDLFCGAGGLSLGFSAWMDQPFQSVWANDFNQDAVATYNANFGEHCLYGDIVGLLADPSVIIPKADVVIGGPPCQGFSLLNKNRLDDERKQLWRPYLEVVKRSEARVFLMENVPQLLGSHEFDAIAEEARRMGFSLAFDKLVAADYGVPQRRKRAFILGCKMADPTHVFPPRRTHINPNDKDFLAGKHPLAHYVANVKPWCTVRDAIADLKPPKGTHIREVAPPYNLHFGRSPTQLSQDRYRAIPKEGMNRFDLLKRAPDLTPPCWIKKKSGGTDLFGRLWWDRPAFTIRTEFFKPEKGRYLHPRQHRPITHREAARFQSFPDDFAFKGTKTQIARQIGNAVPPLLAARLADCVRQLLTATHADAEVDPQAMSAPVA